MREMVSTDFRRLWLVGATLCACAGCEDRAEDATPRLAGGRPIPVVFAVNYPLKYFAERIAGDLAKVELPAPPGVDPAFWKPMPETILALQGADLILLNGAGYSPWVGYSTLPASRLINTSAGFTRAYIRDESVGFHSHGPGEAHAHGDLAFTTWLDPILAIQQARAIHDGLAKLLPAQSDLLQRRYELLKHDLEDLDAKLNEATRKFRGHPIAASHPVYQYFAKRYRLDMRSVHWEPEDVPSPQQWAELQSLLERHSARWMIWEAPPQTIVEDGLRDRGIECIVFYPCGNVPTKNRDLLQTMMDNVGRLQAAIGGP